MYLSVKCRRLPWIYLSNLSPLRNGDSVCVVGAVPIFINCKKWLSSEEFVLFEMLKEITDILLI